MEYMVIFFSPTSSSQQLCEVDQSEISDWIQGTSKASVQHSNHYMDLLNNVYPYLSQELEEGIHYFLLIKVFHII